MKQASLELSDFLLDYIGKIGLEGGRKQVLAFTEELCKILIPLALPIKNELVGGNLRTKGLYSLWITLLDDSIDKGLRIRDEICENINIVSCFASGNLFLPKTIYGRILQDMLTLFSKTNRNNKGELIMDLALTDLLGDLYGFFYETISRETQEIVTISEYMEHSANTIDFLFLLDCDLSLLEDVELNDIMLTREVHRYFSKAFRLLNDLATFQKEYYSEKSPNIVGLILREKMNTTHPVSKKTEREISERLRLRITGYEKKIREKLKIITFFDSEAYYKNVEKVLEEYPANLEKSRNNLSKSIFQF